MKVPGGSGHRPAPGQTRCAGGRRSQEAGSLLAAAAAAVHRQKLAFPDVESTVSQHLPLMKAGTAQRPAIGAGAAGFAQLDDVGHGPMLNV